MLKRAWAIGAVVLASTVAACAQPPTPSPEATQSAQPVAGIGWTLLRTVSPTLVVEGIAVAPLGADQYLVSVTVSGAGVGGCDAPTFVGFQIAGTTLVAQITRSPASESCAVTSAVTFYVALDRLLVPDTIVRIETDQPCEGTRCAAPIPRPSG